MEETIYKQVRSERGRSERNKERRIPQSASPWALSTLRIVGETRRDHFGRGEEGGGDRSDHGEGWQVRVRTMMGMGKKLKAESKERKLTELRNQFESEKGKLKSCRGDQR